MMNTTRLLPMVLLGMSALFWGCTGSGKDLPTLTNDGKASLHSVKSTDLKAAMHDLNSLVFERLYSEIDRDKMRVRYSREIAAMAESMAEDIKTIKQTGETLDLTPSEQQHFLKLADELDTKSRFLQRIAQEHRTESIQPAINELIDVCNRCHADFREVDQ